MLTIELVDDIQDERLSSWTELLDKIENPLPFQRYEWIKCWWEGFATKKIKLFILLAKENNELIGIAPLMQKRSSILKINIFEFIGTGFFDYFDFIIKKGKERTVIISFIDYINTFRYFELKLKNIFQNSSTFKILTENIFSRNLNGTFFPEDSVPYIELPETKQQFYSQLSNTLRLDISRRERRLNELGKLEFQECARLDEAINNLEDFFYLHIKRWTSSNGYSVYKFKSRRDFLRNLLKRLLDKRIVNIYSLSLEERKLAVCFAFKMNHRFIYYTFSHEPEFARFSPGKVLLSKLINYAIEHRCREFDFGIGSEGYKFLWPCKIRRLYNVYILCRENVFLNIFLKMRRFVISIYYLYVLPNLRRVCIAVYLWRWLNSKRGQYKRFQ